MLKQYQTQEQESGGVFFKTAKDRSQAYTNLFGTPEGALVLADVLDLLHFWEGVRKYGYTGDEDSVLRSAAMTIIGRCHDGDAVSFVTKIVGMRLRAPRKEQKECHQTQVMETKGPAEQETPETSQ